MQLVHEEHGWFDFSKEVPKAFIIKDTREEEEIVIDSIDSCITVVFIVNNGKIRIGKIVYDVKEGDVVMFPSAITHPWTPLINTIVAYPKF